MKVNEIVYILYYEFIIKIVIIHSYILGFLFYFNQITFVTNNQTSVVFIKFSKINFDELGVSFFLIP